MVLKLREAKNSDKQNARIEHDNALRRVMNELLADHTELFKQFSDNPSFKKWLSDTVFGVTYQEANPSETGAPLPTDAGALRVV